MPSAITSWLQSLNINLEQLLPIAEALGLIALISIVIHLVLHRGGSLWLQRRTTNAQVLQNILFSKKLFSRFALLIQGIVISIQTQLWLSHASATYELLHTLTLLWIILFGLLSSYALLNVVETLLYRSATSRNIPLKGIIQSIKIIAFVIAALFATSILIGKSPVLLLSGLGAMTAVIMLVFKDPILGLVAGIQLSANQMLSVGDWLEMPKYGADGNVIDISLTTVKVQNWDKTITTIPTYALISDSFKNWKGMQESGGRRIKRSVLIDANSIHFLTPEEQSYLRKAQLLEPYLAEKEQELNAYNQMSQLDLACRINGRRLTNIGSFRAYLERYLRNHPQIHQGMTLMVRQLAPTHDGVALEIYCFTNTVVWVEYEGIQSDIFDHIYSVLPDFGLRVSQAPTGSDFQALAR
ncbi:mechanosensitive ion channel family protein [Vibrio anguillarum]|uniref:mechanosensitive ion channel family protein n=1 Tax=Vibrio anguillarum TaxID=55601 RepID=UPI00097E1F32|nr:mechanosensitive ion channel family protein [Vibrio anguillarum]MBF4283290.1 mechanosensitive ion channel family protein [Vibrio anguillarum]MBF4287588.1 mechanosensitive ion channel family protein [Vibrio anguillarum]MBF4342178.1 mechanosensitive ion channel family protein [Vibrio anguillarum]MBF4355603.1 mechanosensitive ion channel family protein [Vibrio anguillarum]MBF4379651.1 mechanosensitive ion channel family protein [Vibrio anguillarum]